MRFAVMLLLIPLMSKGMFQAVEPSNDPALWQKRVILLHRASLQKRMKDLDLGSFDCFSGLSYRLQGIEKPSVGIVIDMILLCIDMYNHRVAEENAYPGNGTSLQRVKPWQRRPLIEAMLKDEPLVIERLRQQKVI